MVFSSIPFLLYFLPFLLIIYYIAPKKYKNLVMLLASLIFFAWGEIRYLFVMMFLTGVDYICGKNIDKNLGNKKKMRMFMLIDVGLNLTSLIFFKYTDFIIGNINMLFGIDIPLTGIPLPLGVSFNAFQSMSYIIDVYKRRTTSEKSYYNYVTYTTLFPQVIAGPIVRYITVEEEISDRNLNLTDLSMGMRRFLQGLGKKVLIANNIGYLWTLVQTGRAGEMSVLLYWLGILAFTFQLYFDFSGYSDMAIGLSQMFGLYIDENFNFPYISTSITEFWRRWHMTLGSWFRDYVYIPLGGNKKGTLIQIRNILIVWALTGLWHGPSWNFVIWGLFFAAILVLEKFVLFKFWEKVFRPLRHLYTMFLVVISWVIFSFENLGELGNYLAGMFGFLDVPAFNGQSLHYLVSYALIFVIAIVLSTPLLKNILVKLESSDKRVAYYGATAFYIAIFLGSLMYLISSTYNPFLYFKF